METALEKNFSAIIHAHVQEEVCSKIHDMKRLDREERTLCNSPGIRCANKHTEGSGHGAQVLNSKKMVTLMSHVPRNGRDSKLKQHLTQIKLSCKSNGQRREHASEATRSIRMALVTGVKFCVTKICN